ncbi:ATP-binding protein [Amycolatopsis lurida]
MRTGLPSPVLAGRDAEFALLADAFADAGTGSATVLVGGEAGIGKSRLISEFAAAQQARVLVGGCLELGENGLPFAPFTAVLRAIGPEEIRELSPGGTGELGRLLPSLGPPDRDGDELARARLFEQILAVFQGLAERESLLLAVEDLHWADRSSRDLLRFLVRSQPAIPGLLLLISYRSDQLDPAARSLLAELARLDWVRRLELARLPKNAVTVQLRGLLGHEPEPGLSERIFRKSEGNPLFVEALLACAGQSGPSLPQSIRDLLRAPLERLEPRSQEVVRAAAAGGSRVGHRLLAVVTELDDAALSDAVRPAVAANLLVADEDEYAFRHALIREVVYEDLLPGERAMLHTRYGEALDEDASLVARPEVELARHWYAVRKQHPERALAASWAAASTAGKSLAYAERSLFLSRVLELGADPSAVLEEAIEAAVSAGEGDRAMTLIEAAVEEFADDPVRLARVLRHRGELRYALGLPGDLDDLREAARLIPDGHMERRPALNALAARLMTVPCEDKALVVAEEASRTPGDVRSELVARINLAYLRADLPELARVLTAAEELDDQRIVLHTLRCQADLLVGAGQYRRAADVARCGLSEAAKAGLSRTSGPAHAGNLAEALIALGDWDEANEILEHALELDPTPSLRAYLLVLRGTIGLARGDRAPAEEAVAYAGEVFTRGTAYAQDLLLLVQLQVELMLAQGKETEAGEAVARALADDSVTSARYLWPVVATGPWPVGELPVDGPVQRAHQLTHFAECSGERDDWTRAADAWAELCQPYPEARAALRAGDLRRAHALADALGAGGMLAEIERLAKATRTRLDEPVHEQRFGLTPRELEVLRLLADGRTNREIAGELFIAVKTAGAHVSSILGKLGVTGRVQAATAAHRLGLLE